MGEKGRQFVTTKYNSDRVAAVYATRLKYLQKYKVSAKNRAADERDPSVTGALLSAFDHKWSMSSAFKNCAVNSAPYPSNMLSRPATVRDLCRIAIVTTYPPRECGIATFSSMLEAGLLQACGDDAHVRVVAVKHKDHDLNDYNRWVGSSCCLVSRLGQLPSVPPSSSPQPSHPPRPLPPPLGPWW